MRTFVVLGVLLVIVALLAGCSGKIGSVEEKPPNIPASPPTPPVVKPADTAPATLIQAGTGYDEESGKLTGITNTFKAADNPVIHVLAQLEGLEKGEEISGTLIAVKVTTDKGEVIKNYEVITSTVKAPGENPTVHFYYSPPDAGWPKGDYRVVIKCAGEERGSIDLKIK